MSEKDNDMSRVLQSISVRWPVVVAAVVVTAALGAAYAFGTAPEPGYVGSAKIRLGGASASVANAPTVDFLLASADSPQVVESAAATLGIDPAEFEDRIATAVDTKDKQTVVVQVTTSDSDSAEEWTDAVAWSLREYASRPFEPSIDYQESSIRLLEERIAALEDKESELLGKIPVVAEALQPSYENSLFSVTSSITELRIRVENAHLTVTGLRGVVAVLGDPIVTAQTSQGYLASNVLRGAAVGLVIGALVATVAGRGRRSV